MNNGKTTIIISYTQTQNLIEQMHFEKLYLHTQSFYSVDEFLIFKMIYGIFVKCL